MDEFVVIKTWCNLLHDSENYDCYSSIVGLMSLPVSIFLNDRVNYYGLLLKNLE